MMDPAATSTFLAIHFCWAASGALAGSLARGPIALPHLVAEGKGLSVDPGVVALILAGGWAGMVWGNTPEQAATIGVMIGLAGRPMIRNMTRPILRRMLDAALGARLAMVAPSTPHEHPAPEQSEE